ncbi:MAG: hypothetical protein ACLP51_14400 [Syntrophobacteraceae bacterium]
MVRQPSREKLLKVDKIRQNPKPDFRQALIERLQTTHALASNGERRLIRRMIRWLNLGGSTTPTIQ